MDFCTLKHPGDMDIWNNYNLKAHFSNDLSNITIHPPGETIFPISLGEEQQFKWQFKAMDSGPAYLKHTVFLDYLKKMSIEGESVLIFAKELNFQVISIGSMGMPMLRILCMILILSSGVWFMLERASSAELKQVKKIENIQDLPSR